MHMLPLFESKQTFARIDFLRQGGRLVDKKGTLNVKFLTKNQTKKTIMCVCTRMGNSLNKPARTRHTCYGI